MFGFSFSEVVLIGVVTLIAVGPKRLPGLLRDLAKWIRKLRKMTTEVRQQTGIDEMLRAEGLHGGLNELRGLMRGGGFPGPAAAPAPIRIPSPPEDPYSHLDMDVAREYPPEGPDSKGALPDDLTAEDDAPAAPAPSVPVSTSPAAADSTSQTADEVAASAKANAPS